MDEPTAASPPRHPPSPAALPPPSDVPPSPTPPPANSPDLLYEFAPGDDPPPLADKNERRKEKKSKKKRRKKGHRHRRTPDADSGTPAIIELIDDANDTAPLPPEQIAAAYEMNDTNAGDDAMKCEGKTSAKPSCQSASSSGRPPVDPPSFTPPITADNLNLTRAALFPVAEATPVVESNRPILVEGTRIPNDNRSIPNEVSVFVQPSQVARDNPPDEEAGTEMAIVRGQWPFQWLMQRKGLLCGGIILVLFVILAAVLGAFLSPKPIDPPATVAATSSIPTLSPTAQSTTNFSKPCKWVDTTIVFDDYPGEISWKLQRAGVSDDDDFVISKVFQDSYQGRVYTEGFCLETGQYSFVIEDSAGDGLCCNQFERQGSYTVTSQGEVLAKGGDFDHSETTLFEIRAGASEICPTLYADFHRRQLVDFSNETFVLEEGGSAKHVPFLMLSDDGKTGTVVVGNGGGAGGVYHPMVASDDPGLVHFITHIMVEDQDGNVLVVESLDPTVEAPAKITFDVPAGVTELIPYEWCNIHGLWKGESVSLSTVVSTERRSTVVCSISDYPKGAWQSVHADFVRQQKKTFNATAPFAEADGEKHTPYIALNDDGTASVLVGKTGGAVHPMKGSTDGKDEPHWITEIYVVDQSGTIVTMSSLDPTGVNTATTDFEIPEGAESLRAYSWCNLHGLWEGPVVEVETASTAQSEGFVPSVSTGFAAATAFLAVFNM